MDEESQNSVHSTAKRQKSETIQSKDIAYVIDSTIFLQKSDFSTFQPSYQILWYNTDMPHIGKVTFRAFVRYDIFVKNQALSSFITDCVINFQKQDWK